MSPWRRRRARPCRSVSSFRSVALQNGLQRNPPAGSIVLSSKPCLHFVAWLSRARAEGAPGDQMCSPGHPLPEKQGAASSIAVADELQAVEVGLRVCTNGPFGCCCMRVVFFRKCVLEVQNRRFFFGSRLSALAGLGYSWGRRTKKGADLACPRGS